MGVPGSTRAQVQCLACLSPHLESINQAMIAGVEGVRPIAARFGISKSSLTRHRPHITNPPVPPVRPVPLPVDRPGHEAGHEAAPTPTAPAAPESPDPPENEPELDPTHGWSSHARNVRETLTPTQDLAAVQLGHGMSIEKVAVDAGVNERTVRRWMREDDFRLAMREALDRARYRLEARLFALSDHATVIVQRLMNSKSDDQQYHGAKLALGNAVRMAARYRELQIEGYVPQTPMIVFPQGTRMPWNSLPLPVPRYQGDDDTDAARDEYAVELQREGERGGNVFTPDGVTPDPMDEREEDGE